MQNYSIESCCNESSAVGGLLYISNNLFVELKSELCIYNATEFETSFKSKKNKCYFVMHWSSSSYGLDMNLMTIILTVY